MTKKPRVTWCKPNAAAAARTDFPLSKNTIIQRYGINLFLKSYSNIESMILWAPVRIIKFTDGRKGHLKSI